MSNTTIEPTRVEYDGIKATVYSTCGFMGNVTKSEVRLLATGTSPYAQYPSLPFVEFKKKGGRKVLSRQASGFRPWLLVVEGWNQPEPDEMLGEKRSNEDGTVSTRTGRYVSFDARWTQDFAETVFPQITGRVLVDVREK